MLSAVSAYVVTVAFVINRRLGQVTKGATAVEYGLLVALIASVIIVAVSLLGRNLSSLFNGVSTKIVAP
jgi:pilus assembly protein Flp/PilA